MPGLTKYFSSVLTRYARCGAGLNDTDIGRGTKISLSDLIVVLIAYLFIITPVSAKIPYNCPIRD